MAGQDVKGKLKTAGVDKIVSIKVKEKENKNKIAVLYAEGEIRDEDSSSPFSADEQVISEEMANKLRKLKDDDDVKAVVFRVNSPGGSAYISEQIWKEVVELNALNEFQQRAHDEIVQSFREKNVCDHIHGLSHNPLNILLRQFFINRAILFYGKIP